MPEYFEDLVGGDTRAAGSYTVTRDEIVTFAEQFNPQPFHTDEVTAAESMFGGLVASGLHTLCLSIRLFVTDYIDERNLANTGGNGMGQLRW